MKSVILCDLDGVVWLSHDPIPGSVEAITALRAAGHRVIFVTNNSYSLVESQEQSLAKIGLPSVGDVLTSAGAAATLLKSGQRILVAGGPGIVEAVEHVDAVVVGRTDDDLDETNAQKIDVDIDAVIVGFHRTFNYLSLHRASAAVRAGATLIGTNDDATYPTPTGVIPGGGSILAAIATAGGVEPIVAGKPYAPMGTLVRRALDREDLTDCWMVGDRYSTDGEFAKSIGAKFAHVTSGVTSREQAESLQLKHTFELVVDNLLQFARDLGVAV
ncbi:MAG: HAD-IIA family hydrolase [Acidimicrobiaceae bacterium]|nr:HAD-IIA family hydrolase [Acidimicrobiaceae bacterium]